MAHARITLCPTPIGNLKDLPERVRECLQEADEIWCEDTRETQKLLSLCQVITPANLFRMDENQTSEVIERQVRRIHENGRKVAFVSDAGTPGISDPGARIVQIASRFEGVEIDALPGPSSLTVAVSLMGFLKPEFEFLGFIPRNDKDFKEQILQGLSQKVWFQSPHRIEETIRFLQEVEKENGLNAEYIFAKELTKHFQRVWRGVGLNFLQDILEKDWDSRGEWVVGMVLNRENVKNEKAEQSWELALKTLLEAGVSSGDAAKLLHKNFGVAKNLAYSAALFLKK